MNWYLAKIVFRIICGTGNHTPQFDEQIRLVTAASYTEALARVRDLGIKEQDLFLNQKSELVEWKFINVVELKMIDELKDGMELYSRVEEAEDASRYIEFINNKAEELKAGLFVTK